jgi:hypothetical protein
VISKALQQLTQDWTKEGGNVRFPEVKGGGHLPILDTTKPWINIVVKFLRCPESQIKEFVQNYYCVSVCFEITWLSL